MTALIFASLLTMTQNAPGGSPDGRPTPRTPEIRWTLHVLYFPGTRDARPALIGEGGTIAVGAPWQCAYKRVTDDQQEIVKIKCVHESGAVVGTLAMCRREGGQSDLAQVSIGVDGVATYETIDLSCSVLPRPPQPSHGEELSDDRK